MFFQSEGLTDLLNLRKNVRSTKESMKAFVQSHYDNATVEQPAPTYLLIVGDHEQIPSFQMGNGNWGGHTSE